MHWNNTLDIWFYIAGAIITLFLFFYALPRRNITTVPYFIKGVSMVFIWCALAAVELLTLPSPAKVFLCNAFYIPIPFTCVYWLFFALSFTRRTQWLTWKSKAFFVVIPTITVLLALTSTSHNFMFGEGGFQTSGGIPVLMRPYGPWFWVHTIYSYIIVLAGSAMVIGYVVGKDFTYRSRGYVMVIGAIFPFIANLLYLMLRGESMHLDYTPLAMAVAAMFFAWGIFRYRLFDLVPIARTTVFDCIEDVVFILDTHDRIVDLNPAASRFLAATKERVIGESLAEIGHLMPQFKIQNLLDLKDEIISSQDQRSHYNVTTTPIYSAKKVVLGKLITLHDISRLKRNESALTEAKERAEAATAAKSDFLATMSHEIRTPMNGVLGYTSLLMDTRLEADQRSYVEIIQSSGKTLLTLINDILDFSKIEAGKVQLERHAFFLHKIVEEIMDAVVKRASRKNIDLACHIHPETKEALYGDAVRIKQILVNLLDNAIKFTDRGRVSLIIDSVTQTHDLQQHRYIRFTVQDTGIGISEERLESIFASFTQADSSTTRKYGGTGLGLAICRRLCKMMGGDINVTSELGKGSTFQCTIRAYDVQSARFLATYPQPPLHLTGQRLLIVSENPVRSAYVSSMCDTANLKTMQASTAAEMIALLKEGKIFDALIIDDTPGIHDTLDAIQAIRRKGIEWPIILLGERNDIEPDDALRITHVLPKPIKRTVFYSALGSCITGEGEMEAEPTTPLFDRSLGQTNPLRILIAEDDNINQQLAQLLFSRMGYNPDIVSNGKEVLEAVSRQSYDVIFMDIYMPEMDGLSAAKSIHAASTRHNRPRIIAMTASVTPYDKKRCREANMDGFISKPIDIDKLTTTLKALRRRSHSQQAQAKPKSPPQPRTKILT